MALWQERSLPTCEARVRFRPGCHTSGSSLLFASALLLGFFFGFSGFPPCTIPNVRGPVSNAAKAKTDVTSNQVQAFF